VGGYPYALGVRPAVHHGLNHFFNYRLFVFVSVIPSDPTGDSTHKKYLPIISNKKGHEEPLQFSASLPNIDLCQYNRDVTV
jgi:hypothetical protein